MLIRRKRGSKCTFNFVLGSLIHWLPTFVYFRTYFVRICTPNEQICENFQMANKLGSIKILQR